jgi:hypothetical protein
VHVDAVEPLRELNVADLPADLRVHEEAHGLPDGLAVVDVVITVQVEHEWRVGQHGGDANLSGIRQTRSQFSSVQRISSSLPSCSVQYQSVHGAGLLVVLESRALLTGDVHEAGQLVALGVVAAAVAQEHLDHAGVVAGVVPGPRRAVLHDPPLCRHLHGLGHQRVDPDLELLILSLPVAQDQSAGTTHRPICESMHRQTRSIEYLHGAALLHEGGLHLVLEVVDLEREVELRGAGLDAELLAEGHPLARELGRLRQRLERQHRRAVVGDVAGDLVHGVVYGEDGEHGVGGHQRRLLERVHRAHEQVHRRQQRRLPFPLVPASCSVVQSTQGTEYGGNAMFMEEAGRST